jgi:hypothetical protein
MEGVMFARLFPKQFDNTYRGHWLALILFGLLLLLDAVIGTNSILNTRSVMTGADGIPLDSFSPQAAQEAILEFALLGLWRLFFVLLGLVALIRYRAMVPFLFLLLIVQQLAGRLVHALHSTEGGLTQAGSVVVWGMLGVIVVGFVLSLVGRSERG